MSSVPRMCGFDGLGVLSLYKVPGNGEGPLECTNCRVLIVVEFPCLAFSSLTWRLASSHLYVHCKASWGPVGSEEAVLSPLALVCGAARAREASEPARGWNTAPEHRIWNLFPWLYIRGGCRTILPKTSAVPYAGQPVSSALKLHLSSEYQTIVSRTPEISLLLLLFDIRRYLIIVCISRRYEACIIVERILVLADKYNYFVFVPWRRQSGPRYWCIVSLKARTFYCVL